MSFYVGVWFVGSSYLALAKHERLRDRAPLLGSALYDSYVGFWVNFAATGLETYPRMVHWAVRSLDAWDAKRRNLPAPEVVPYKPYFIGKD